jgi:hypothetical protein
MKLSEIRKRTRLYESQLQYTKEERKAFLESIREFGNFKKELFRESGIVNEKTGRPVPFSQRLKQISEEIGQLIETAEAFTLQETENNFDKIAVSRDLKEIKNDYKIFEKACMEMAGLQQRVEFTYENMANKLGRYYDI